MGMYEKLLFKQMSKLPFMKLEAVVREKLKAGGAPKPGKAAREIVRALRAGREPRIRWAAKDETADKTIDVSLSPDEIDEMIAETEAFVENGFGSMVADLRTSASRAIGKTLAKDWPAQWKWQTETDAGFRERLEDRWGEAFTYLRMMLTISREIAGEVHRKQAKRRSKKNQHKREVMQRLHGRGCQIVAEILTLMQNGFADGAMARWRTLHEITVVAALIADHDDDLARRYLDHEAVESKRALDLHRKHEIELGLLPFEASEIAEIEGRFEDMRQRYGKLFLEPYGWAAHHVGCDGKQFRHLEDAADKAANRPYYKMASYNVHAGTKGITFRLGLLGREGFLSGASNAGFLEPTQHTAFSLTHLTGLLLSEKLGFDEQIQMQIILDLRDKIPPALRKSDRKLRRDDLNFRQRALRKSAAPKKSAKPAKL